MRWPVLPLLSLFLSSFILPLSTAGQDNDSYFDALSLRLGSTTDCDGLPLGTAPYVIREAQPLNIHPNPGPGPVTVAWPQDFIPEVLRIVDSLGNKVAFEEVPTGQGWQLTLRQPVSGTLLLMAWDRHGRVARGQWVVAE